jgi:hypothetical protein
MGTQVLTPEMMPDAVLATLNSMRKDQWIGQMTDISNHVAFNLFCHGNGQGKASNESGGRGVKMRIVTDTNHSAKHTGLYETDDFAISDAVVEGEVPWRGSSANMVFDRKEESMNAGEDAVFNRVKVERARALTDLADLSEAACWGKPADSTDNKTPFGIQYWVTKNATTGFNGGDPAGFPAGRAGVSSSTYSRNRNFTGKYTSIDATKTTGLPFLIRMGADKMRWISPTPIPDMGRGGKSNYIIGMNWDTKNDLEVYAEGRNDVIGFDLQTHESLFRGTKLTYVPYLDAATDNPVYMLDTNYLYAHFLKGWDMTLTMIDKLPNQHTCFAFIWDMVWNLVCDDVRRNAVFYR